MLDGRIMGLDVGDKTIGVAVSNIIGLTAQGVTTVRRVGKKKNIDVLKEIIAKRQVNKIVLGLPKKTKYLKK
jgi:putative Holliday junction resolvase